jgi:hypothetical protein
MKTVRGTMGRHANGHSTVERIRIPFMDSSRQPEDFKTLKNGGDPSWDNGIMFVEQAAPQRRRPQHD